MGKQSIAAFILVVMAAAARADSDAVERGRTALFTRSFTLAGWSFAGFDNAWRQWEPKLNAAPKDYEQTFREHYGLHPAPFDNGRLPMGLREARTILGAKGVATDCMLCHAGSMFGKSIIGLGNSSLDVHALF